MRIAHISEAFGGGLRTAIVNYVTGADHHDHHLFVRTRVGHETFAIPTSATMTVFGGSMVGFFREARKFVAEGNFDIVHLHSSYAGLLRGILPAGTRIVYSPHCYAMEAGHPPAKRAVYWAVERLMAQREQMLMGVGPRELEIGHSLRPRMPMREVPNCATPMGYPEEPDIAATKPIVAMSGRIADQKDPAFFAAVADIVDDDLVDFVWIGEGDEGAEHLERAGIRITGWLTPTDTRRILKAASLYLHTAAWEGAPLSTLEAAEVGCPVLSRSIPSMVALGYPLAGTTPEAAAATVERFFAEPAFQEDVRLHTKDIAASFSFEHMATRLEEAYEFAGRRLGVQPVEESDPIHRSGTARRRADSRARAVKSCNATDRTDDETIVSEVA